MSRNTNSNTEVAGTVTNRLSDNEKALLAREVAADGRTKRRDYKFRCPDCSELFFDTVAIETVRSAFTDGWDAAMEYAAKVVAEGIEHLDGESGDGERRMDELEKRHALVRRAIKVMRFVSSNYPNEGVLCDVWEHDVDCTCLVDSLSEVFGVME